MTIFREGDHVDFVGDGLDGIPPAPGRILSIASHSAVHVEWLAGHRLGQIDLVDVADLEKSASIETVVHPTVSAGVLVRQIMRREGSAGVLQYLSAIHQLESWQRIAAEALSFVEGRLRVDASLDLPYEMLEHPETEQIVRAGALALLRDAFQMGEGAR